MGCTDKDAYSLTNKFTNCYTHSCALCDTHSCAYSVTDRISNGSSVCYAHRRAVCCTNSGTFGVTDGQPKCITNHLPKYHAHIFSVRSTHSYAHGVTNCGAHGRTFKCSISLSKCGTFGNTNLSTNSCTECCPHGCAHNLTDRRPERRADGRSQCTAHDRPNCVTH